MSDLPDKLVGGPDDTDDGFAWVEEKFNPDDGMAVVTSEGGLCGNHPNRRYILEEMVQRYNAHEGLEAEVERLRELEQKCARLEQEVLQHREMEEQLKEGLSQHEGEIRRLMSKRDRLREALEVIADGDGDPQIIARQTLDALGGGGDQS